MLSYTKIRGYIKFMYVCMYVCMYVVLTVPSWYLANILMNRRITGCRESGSSNEAAFLAIE